MKKIQYKMKALECQQNYMSFFSDAQGKLTLKSVVEFCRNSNFGPIRPGTAELAALEHLKRFPLTYNGKIWLAP